jgi:hypothetical protein
VVPENCRIVMTLGSWNGELLGFRDNEAGILVHWYEVVCGL